MKKNFFLDLSLKKKKLYRLYLYYNLYIRNFKYLIKKNYSQLNEDLFLKKYFNKNKGFFIDIGCHHPYRGNNTYLLYKNGWSGINIDLSKITIDLFQIFRPRDINLNFALSNKIEKINLYIPNDNLLSTEITTSKKFSKILNKRHDNFYKSFKTYSVNWNFIEKKYKIYLRSVDLLKIDIEGSDLKILKTINLKKLSPKLIMIEAPTFDKISRNATINYLKNKNYKIIFDNKLNIICKKKGQ
jgi:hypothetical protein